MTPRLYLAPAGHGKTAYALERIRQARAAAPLASVTVILPNQPQLNAFRHRLSTQGGALGVNLNTFYTLYAQILAWAGQPEPRLPEPVQYRLLRTIIADLTDAGRLPYYAPLRDKPGFVTTLRALLEELKRARIHRDNFIQAIHALPNRASRLAELAEIYTAYQDWLLEQGWVDIEGQGWLAASALERQPDLGRHLQLLIIDGFDEFNPTQLAVLKLLANRAAETIITLTGEMSSKGAPIRAEGQGSRGAGKIENLQSPLPRPALRRFTRALQALSRTLNLDPEPLPDSPAASVAPALAYLEANLFELHSQTRVPRPASSDSVSFIETQNRAEEVRAALRWLKARLVRDQMSANEIALIVRDLTPYRPFIEETAAEFGLTLHLREGLNLAANPAIAALMSLLALPLKNHPDGNWAYRPLVDAWRSPYFEKLAPGLTPRSADHLNTVARQGLVLQGLEQWREAFDQQLRRASRQSQTAALDDEEGYRPDYLSKDDTLTLQMAFETFVTRLTPPAQATLQEYVAFLENLIGQDPELEQDAAGQESADPSLGIVRRARLAPATTDRDIAALRAFKDVLRGLVLAGSFFQQSTAGSPAESEIITYPQFYEEVLGAVQGATYYLPPPEPLEAALPVLSVLNARGLSFRAVALLGLSEGEFPQAEREDVLLREEDRFALQRVGLAGLEPRLRGDELTFFYQAITRARDKLLLCRPYLADDGQKWEPSPYWQQVQRLAADAPASHIRPEDPLPLRDVASSQELAGTLTQLGLAEFELAEHWSAHDTARLQHSGRVLRARLAAEAQGPFEGDLSALSAQFSAAYGPEQVWSSSRLEAYGLCPHHFWLGQDLALEPRQPPEEGFDVFILGSMYHEILEEVYRLAGTEVDSERLLELLPAVAEAVFDKAPAVYGFRPTPLWAMQRRELEQILAQTLVALAEATTDSTPLAQEQVFGMRDQPPLLVQRDGDQFRVRGFIDRVDQDAEGRLRIIDYKCGSTPIAARDLAEGRRLQIALYALAARDALQLGQVADGFYWHIGSAKASSLKLANFEGGLEAALNTAIAHAFNHIAGVRAGRFPPAPPSAGCPNHCPGATFCWRYKAKGW